MTKCPYCHNQIAIPLCDHISDCPAVRFAFDRKFDNENLRITIKASPKRKNRYGSRAKRGQNFRIGKPSKDFKE